MVVVRDGEVARIDRVNLGRLRSDNLETSAYDAGSVVLVGSAYDDAQPPHGLLFAHAGQLHVARDFGEPVALVVQDGRVRGERL